ncbi:MAG: cupin [Candidatus Peregrinibacteria bacterium GW2011_GWF2_39_17]|nr:MAG: cupin [Candidatus Peregrinibacteria bacterium GW2011_GWF2_39_17]HCW32356.1 hypothetical protein [Candidatus Peregrinibacteria bacterium]
MKIHSFVQVPEEKILIEGAKDTTIKVLVGQNDGSEKITMRYFSIKPGGHTPYHQHPYCHVVRIEQGQGLLVDKSKKEHVVKKGDSFYVAPNDFHQFKNPNKEDFEFLCVIPNET